MNHKELTKTFMMILNWKPPFSCDVFLQINSALQGLKRIGPTIHWSVYFSLYFFDSFCHSYTINLKMNALTRSIPLWLFIVST